MATIFDNYENQTTSKKPPLPPTPFKPERPKRPFEDYNAEGELIGYWWTQGDLVDLEFNLSGYVIDNEANTYIEARDFIVDKTITMTLYNFRHEQITSQTISGVDCQNVTYSIDRNVTPLTSGMYYTYNDGTYTAVTLPDDYSSNTIYYKQDDVKIPFTIDKELAEQLVKGTYYISMAITSTNEDFALTVFYEDSCTLTIR